MNLKKIILILFLSILSINCCAKSSTKIQNWYTSCGTKVLFIERHELPIFDLNVSFYAGSIFDEKNFGLANFVSATLNTGAKNLTADEIADGFDNLGALFYNYADKDSNQVTLRCLSDKSILKNSLLLFAKVLTEASFPEKEINRVRKQLLTFIEKKKQQPSSMAYDEFFQELYQDFPYSHPTIGTEKTIALINRKLIQDFYHKYYTARNAVITIVGDVSRKQAEELSEELTAKMQLGEKIPRIKAKPKNPKAITKQQEFPSTQTNVIIGQLGIARSDPDYFPLYVGNHILGAATMTSELFLKVREKLGLVYSIYSNFFSGVYQGSFLLYFSSSNEKVDKALQVSLKTLSDFMKNGPTTKELLMAKKNLVGTFPLQLASNSAAIDALREVAFYDLPLDYFATYIEKINAVTLKDIQDSFKRHINLNDMVIIKVGKSIQQK
jgi:zinc protease